MPINKKPGIREQAPDKVTMPQFLVHSLCD